MRQELPQTLVLQELRFLNLGIFQQISQSLLQKSSHLIHIELDVGHCVHVGHIAHVSLVVNEHQTAELQSKVIPVSHQLQILPVGLWDFDQNVVNVALPAQQELKTIIVIDDHVEPKADSEFVEFLRLQQHFGESLLPDVLEADGGDVLHDCVEEVVEFAAKSSQQAVVLVAAVFLNR